MKFFIHISLIGILFFGCTKFGKNISVRGRVYNPITNEGIPNVEIRLLKEDLSSISGGNKGVKTVYTDANGYYELDHASASSRYIGCFLDNYEYYRIGWFNEGENIGKSTVYVNKGKYTYLDYQVVQYGKIKQNVNYRVNPNDKIFQPGIHYGCYSYSGTSSSDIPMGYYDITWTVTKPSAGTNTFTGEVFIPAGGIGEITINY